MAGAFPEPYSVAETTKKKHDQTPFSATVCVKIGVPSMKDAQAYLCIGLLVHWLTFAVIYLCMDLLVR